MQKHNQHFTLLFFKGNLYLVHQNKYLLYLIFSSRESQRRLIQTKVYYKLFRSVWKETSYKPLKVGAAKKSFPSVYIIGKTCFEECFLFHVITGRDYFFTQIQRYPEVWCSRQVAAFFETSVLKDICILHKKNICW